LYKLLDRFKDKTTNVKERAMLARKINEKLEYYLTDIDNRIEELEA
jgi:hypothetical protein